MQISLPIHALKDQIIESVENSTFTIITGPTGSGKSTQLP